jgi:hypothetical protein
MNMRNGAPSLLKGIPGAQKMGGNAGPGGMNWEAVEAVFKTATEDMGLDWGDKPTTDQAIQLRKVALAHGLKPRAMHLKAWFDNWYLFYPFVDDIAVERAINFDMDVWPALTARERHRVIVRLSTHPDPWGEQEYALEGGNSLGKVDRSRVSDRVRRWLSIPIEERRVLVSAVGGVRRKSA